jgi:type II restriction enzyme
MNKLDLYYPIINIIREESKRYEYMPNSERKVVVVNEDGEEFACIPMERFLSESKHLIEVIKASSKGTFAIPQSESFMTEIGCERLKAPSKDKTDIRIVIHDLRTNMTPLLGFSIKSQLGSPSTLLNAGVSTNFLYKIEGPLTYYDIGEINCIEEHNERMRAIADKGCSFVYVDVENTTFKNNLLFLDSRMPEIIAACLLPYYTQQSSASIKDAVEKIADINPIGFTGKDVLSFYEHKMKVLLLDAALGMTPATPWKGRYDANGGYLVVKDDGDIVCYHFYNRNDIEDYLYNNTRFERASRSRHNFGSLEPDGDGNVYIRFNLQIRFKK